MVFLMQTYTHTHIYIYIYMVFLMQSCRYLIGYYIFVNAAATVDCRWCPEKEFFSTSMSLCIIGLKQFSKYDMSIISKCVAIFLFLITVRWNLLFLISFHPPPHCSKFYVNRNKLRWNVIINFQSTTTGQVITLKANNPCFLSLDIGMEVAGILNASWG